MSESPKNILQAKEITCLLAENAGIRDISLSLKRGDILGLLGLNGAGKSTTLRIISGVIAPQKGEVWIDGINMQDDPLNARARIGYLPDTPPLYNDMRVLDYLVLAAKLRRVPKSTLDDQVQSVLSSCDLHNVKQQRIEKLSKGYKQRVGLAQAMVHKPALLLLDEPSNGLDPQQMQGMREVIQQASESQAIIFSTHLLNEAQTVCNRLAVLHNGQLKHDDSLDSGNSTNVQTLFNALLQEHSDVAEQ